MIKRNKFQKGISLYDLASVCLGSMDKYNQPLSLISICLMRPKCPWPHGTWVFAPEQRPHAANWAAICPSQWGGGGRGGDLPFPVGDDPAYCARWNLHQLLWNLIEIGLYLPFSDCIYQKMVITIWFRFDLTRFRKYFFVCKQWRKIRPITLAEICTKSY